MVIAELTKYQNVIIKLTLTGHANQGPYGTDIVCSAVSMLATLTGNNLAKLGLLDKMEVQIQPGHAEFTIKDNNENTIQLLMECAWDHLVSLNAQYPNHIMVKLNGGV